MFEKRKSWQIVRGIIPSEERQCFEIAYEEFANTFLEVLANYKQISFSTDYKDMLGWQSPIMWGLYAHNGNGVCIEFDSDKISLPKGVYKSKVKYTRHVPVIKFNEQSIMDETFLECFVKKNRSALFFTKHKHWEYENEYRVISNQHSFLSIDGAIERVYVYDSQNINTRVVEQLNNDDVPISFLRFSHRDGDRNIGCWSLKEQREFEKGLKETPDYYTNQERLSKCFRDINDLFVFSNKKEKIIDDSEKGNDFNINKQ